MINNTALETKADMRFNAWWSAFPVFNAPENTHKIFLNTFIVDENYE